MTRWEDEWDKSYESGQDQVTLHYDAVERDTDLAVLFRGDKEKFWVPKSLISDWDEKKKQFDVPEWFAEKEGLV